MARDGDARVGDWSGRQRRSQRARGERDGDSPRKDEPKAREERPNRNASQSRNDHNGQHAPRQDSTKTRGNRDGRDLQRREHHNIEAPCQNDSRSRVNRNGRNISRKSEPKPHDTTDQYKIEPRVPRRRVFMDDSDSDSEPHPKRKLRPSGSDYMEVKASAPSDQSPPKVTQDKRLYSAADSGGAREDMSSKQRSPKKMRQDDKLVESKTSSDPSSHTPAAISQALLEGTEPTQQYKTTQVCLFSELIYTYTSCACEHTEFI